MWYTNLHRYILISLSYHIFSNSTLEVGSLSGIYLTDADNNDAFQIHSATISLSGDSDMSYEYISVLLDNFRFPTTEIKLLQTGM